MAVRSAKPTKDLARERVLLVTFGTGRDNAHAENNRTQRLVWDTRSPLGLGYPFRWALEKSDEGIRIRRLDGPQGGVPVADSLSEIPFTELQQNPLISLGKAGEQSWVEVRAVHGATDVPLAEDRVQLLKIPPATTEDGLFVKVLTQVLVGGAIASLAIWFLPTRQTKVDELIPKQYAKLLLKPQRHGEAPKETKEVPKEQTRERNVVRAFQSKAVQNTVKKIFKIGAVSALSKSALTGGLGAKGTLDKFFGAQPGATAMPRTLDSTMLDSKSPKVGMLGKGAGSYGKAEVANIAGQGNFQMEIDPGSIAVADGLDKDEVGKAIRQHVGEIRYCYETALTRNSALEGKLVVTFIIGGDGGVKTAGNKETHADAGLVKCILDHLKKWKFPKPRGGAEVEVSYPFIFKSIGG